MPLIAARKFDVHAARVQYERLAALGSAQDVVMDSVCSGDRHSRIAYCVMRCIMRGCVDFGWR